jgi:hypothetical protein
MAKKCKVCKVSYQPFSTISAVCSPVCAIAYAKTKQGIKHVEKAKRAEYRVAKENIKTKATWAKEAQTAFNKYVRLRDNIRPCISCQRHHDGQYHAGHYLSVGSSPSLRFNVLNCHRQCAPCNNHLSGNIVLYRVNLIKKIGLDKLEWLEGPHEPNRYRINELKRIKKIFTIKAKRITRGND